MTWCLSLAGWQGFEENAIDIQQHAKNPPVNKPSRNRFQPFRVFRTTLVSNSFLLLLVRHLLLLAWHLFLVASLLLLVRHLLLVAMHLFLVASLLLLFIFPVYCSSTHRIEEHQGFSPLAALFASTQRDIPADPGEVATRPTDTILIRGQVIYIYILLSCLGN